MKLLENGTCTDRFFEDDWFSDACVPELLEDETVYSWCARFHQLNGGYDSRATSRVLFCNPTAGLRHDIPGHMGAFQLRTQRALGDFQELARKRTLFGFHSMFLPAELDDKLLNQLIVGDSAVVRKQLGLERTGLPEVNPLKFCPACVRQQIQERGVTWWQISQQLPTAFLCRTHGEWLCNCDARRVRGIFPDFQTPLDCHHRFNQNHNDLTPDDREQLIRLADWTDSIQNSEGPRFTDITLRHCYLLKAKAMGWLAFDGTVRMKKVRNEFVNRYRGIFQLFGNDFFGDLSGDNAGFLAYTFRRLPCRRHPLKHVLLINLLFESYEDLLVVHRKVQDAYASGGDRGITRLLCDGQTRLLKLVTADGLSVSRAAAEVGVSDTCAANFLDKSGVLDRPRRPHIVGTVKEKKLTNLLYQGLGHSEIAKKVGVRQAFIKDYLATRPDLKRVWMDAKHQQQIQLHRNQLSTMLKQHSDLPIKLIRRLPSNGFQWLYNNDRTWLQEVLPAIWKR